MQWFTDCGMLDVLIVVRVLIGHHHANSTSGGTNTSNGSPDVLDNLVHRQRLLDSYPAASRHHRFFIFRRPDLPLASFESIDHPSYFEFVRKIQTPPVF